MSEDFYSSLEIGSDERPSWKDIYMRFAYELCGRSTCSRLSVGCVITTFDSTRVLSIGYNGNYHGGPNICDSSEPGNCGCLHSEENAIIKLNYTEQVQKRMYSTHSACKMCAKRIINAGITEFVYSEMYRSDEGLMILQKNGISVVCHNLL